MLASVRFRLKRRHLFTLLLLSTALLIQNVQSVPLSSQFLLKATNSVKPPDSTARSAGSFSASSFNESTTSFNESIKPMQFANWTRSMLHIHKPRAGCFKATYPSTVWQPNQCGTAPLLPLLPSPPSTVGNGNDEVAQVPSGKIIGSSIGSFQSISGLTSETDSMEGANYYGLQDNSQLSFSTSTTYTGGKSAEGWEQFVFVNYPGIGAGLVFIQYWLINYQTDYGSCPSIGPPNGSSWMAYKGSCYANSQDTGTPL